MRIRRRVSAVDTSNQSDLFAGEMLCQVRQEKSQAASAVIFNRPDPRDIFLGAVRLDEHLKAMGTSDALRIRELLQEQSWQEFENRYKPGGRPPYAPEAMLGLIVYGIFKGVSSLRGLEELARIDLGGMWIAGGLCPDHASIGRFVQLHDEQITGDFLTGLTRTVLKVTGTGVESVAGDGTVVQAAASRYRAIKLEAAREAADEARRQADAEPDDPKRRACAEHAEAVKDILQRRTLARQSKGKRAEGLSISALEPEAVVQPQKDKKTFAPSYKPSVLANDGRVIVGWAIDPSSEIAPVPSLLDQAASLGTVTTALFDAGYHSEAVIEASGERDIELLCPQGRALGEDDWTPQSQRQYPKSQFTYDPATDTYSCPAGQILTATDHCQGKSANERYIRYGTTACAGCEQRPRCTTGKGGRKIKRYQIDGAKEVLRNVMSDPEKRKRYRKRQAMVEPVFSVLKLKQGLTRFRRRGLRAVQRELALHVIAYNLSRALALGPFSSRFRPLWSLAKRLWGWIESELCLDYLIPCTKDRPLVLLPALHSGRT